MPGATLGRNERLVSREMIGHVARTGRAVNVHPFRLIGMITPLDTPAPAQVAFAVPKRHLKRAHDRNRMKRLMREVYRRGKAPWHEAMRTTGGQCAWLLVFQAHAPVQEHEVRNKVHAAFDRWIKEHLHP